MVPLFPLPNVVLFPDAYLPLHIFEHRYRTMVHHALDGDRQIGMVVLRDGWQTASLSAPPIYATGCAGAIVHHERLKDGRFNIVLRGTRKFRIRSEERTRAYRQAEVEWMDEALSPARQQQLARLRPRIEALLLPAILGGDARVPPTLTDEELVNGISQYLDIDVVEKLALLEKPDPLARGEALVTRLERLLMEKSPTDGPSH